MHLRKTLSDLLLRVRLKLEGSVFYSFPRKGDPTTLRNMANDTKEEI
jgi:hypothetical protein